MFARFGTKKAALPNPAVDVYQDGTAGAPATGLSVEDAVRHGRAAVARQVPLRRSHSSVRLSGAARCRLPRPELSSSRPPHQAHPCGRRCAVASPALTRRPPPRALAPARRTGQPRNRGPGTSPVRRTRGGAAMSSVLRLRWPAARVRGPRSAGRLTRGIWCHAPVIAGPRWHELGELVGISHR
jgi:hypothetical protein